MNKTENKISYPDYISPKRVPIPTPKNAVENGISHFGTFIKPFENLNLIESKNPLGKFYPNFMLPKKLTQWEVVELNFDDCFFLVSSYYTGFNYMNIYMFYDKITGEVISNSEHKFPGDNGEAMHNNLLDSTFHTNFKNFEIKFVNKFKEGKCYISGQYKPTSKKKVPVEFDVVLTSISEPSVVLIPLGENRPLYTHKELFSVSGAIKIGDKEFKANENSLAIIDDHKGFYPYNMHFDWLTGFKITDKRNILSFNLTRNQSISPDDYNENYIWVNGKIHPLPVIKFNHLDNGHWHIKDEKGLVDIYFMPENQHKIWFNLGIVKSNYIAPFGKMKGYLTDNNGVKHNFDGAFGMGEDKTIRV